MKLPIVGQIQNPLPPQNETANSGPNLKCPLPSQNETANSGPDLKLFQKGWISGQGDILVLADVPPHPSLRNEKVGFQVKVTFWFWLMPPPDNGIGLNMNAIEKNHFK